MTSCIYQIQNIVNSKVYIGSTIHFKKRIKEHTALLTKGIHHARKLQNSWNKYGAKAFVFEILEECPLKELIPKEQYWIDLKDSYYKGFNSRPIAESNRGYKQTEAVRRAKSEATKGVKKPEGFGAKIAASNRLRRLSDETKEKIRQGHLGKKLTEEQKARLKGRPSSFLGKHHTEESKKLLREANLGRVLSEEHVRKVADANTGKKRTEEQRKHISNSLKGRICSEETRRKISEAKKKNCSA